MRNRCNYPSYSSYLLEMITGLVIAPYAKLAAIRACANSNFSVKVLVVIPSFPMLTVATCKYALFPGNVPGERFNYILMWQGTVSHET